MAKKNLKQEVEVVEVEETEVQEVLDEVTESDLSLDDPTVESVAVVLVSERFDLRQRPDGEYDAYDKHSGKLLATGVSSDPNVLAQYL